ncbi:MAG TPA: hypothetical protein VIH76_11980 [Candidatus Acidoferrales bacterium]
MSDSLGTYLNDHLAGSAHAIDLVKSMRDDYAGKPLGDFAASLLVEIEADRGVLQNLADRVGAGSSGLKEFAGWLGEKASRLKLGHDGKLGLGTFEALEFLVLGIHGKWALWRALGAIAPDDSRLHGIDFDQLAARAESQRESVEQWRLKAAHSALPQVKEL